MFAAITALSLSYATTPMMDGDGEDPIDIIYNGPGDGGSENNMRGGIFVPLTAIYYSSLSRVIVMFSDNLGDIDIRLTNMITGGASTIQTNTNIDYISIPVVYGSGYYCLEFLINGVTMYYGYFNVL